jgi:glycosyltransferase involved in cell wall biosynthesis
MLKRTQNNALFGDMYSSFFNALRKNNIKVNLAKELNEISGDILILVIGGGWEPVAAKAMNLFRGPVILYVHNAYLGFNKYFLCRWSSRILFAYNPDFAQLNFKKYKSVNIPYHHFPFASDENIFYPLNLPKQYDIVFIGNGNSGFGREKYIKLLIEYAKKNKLQIFLGGSGWKKYGFHYRIVEHGEQINVLYNTSKICINIHNDRQYLGEEIEMDANNRLFDLAMAQCCQISNGEQMVLKYFEKDEVVTADDPIEWINKIDYYLKNTNDREEVALKARQRAIKDHTWNIRAKEFIDIINQYYLDYSVRSQKINLITLFLRKSDQYLNLKYQVKEIKIIRFCLKKMGLYIQK